MYMYTGDLEKWIEIPQISRNEESLDGDGDLLLQRLAAEVGSHAAGPAEAEQGPFNGNGRAATGGGWLVRNAGKCPRKIGIYRMVLWWFNGN